tara:strand:+ start:29773 stop:30003 length:231 start_codon:yes stop_codon:yes gene_type:complete
MESVERIHGRERGGNSAHMFFQRDGVTSDVMLGRYGEVVAGCSAADVARPRRRRHRLYSTRLEAAIFDLEQKSPEE